MEQSIEDPMLLKVLRRLLVTWYAFAIFAVLAFTALGYYIQHEKDALTEICPSGLFPTNPHIQYLVPEFLFCDDIRLHEAGGMAAVEERVSDLTRVNVYTGKALTYILYFYLYSFPATVLLTFLTIFLGRSNLKRIKRERQKWQEQQEALRNGGQTANESER